MPIYLPTATSPLITARSILQDAFEQIKIYAPGVVINAADGARGLSLMNQFIDELSNQSLSCYANLEQSFPLQIGKNAYTIGTTISPVPDVNATRPLVILTGPGAAYLMDSNNVRYGVDVIEQDQWNQIGLLTETSDLPNTLFYNPQFPLGILNIYPTPSAVTTLYFDARLQISDMANLDTAFSLPPGYSSMLKNNLSVRLWPYYKQGTPDAWLIDLSKETLATVKRTNIRQSPSPYDGAIVGKAAGVYNIYQDSTNSR